MHRTSLGFVAAVLTVLMGIVATAGLDNLPRSLRTDAAAAGNHLAADRTTLAADRDYITGAERSDPDLFASRTRDWNARLDSDRARLDRAGAEATALQKLAKVNRRADAGTVKREIGEFDALRREAVRDANALRTDAEKRLKAKAELPQRAAALRAEYDAIRSFPLENNTQTVRQAMTDWPAKRDDLQRRVDALKKERAESEEVWKAAAPLIASVEAKKLSGFDYDGFFNDADRLDAVAGSLKTDAAKLNTLAGQLYVSWDKLIENVEKGRNPQEKIRLVETRFADATMANPKITSEERWEPLDKAQLRSAEKNVGMVVERKPAGKFDSEAEHVIQPPAYAYVAPPGQSNSYGSWNGGVWNWLPQYLILSHLLHSSQGPITSGDFNAYSSARRRGEIFYGHSGGFRRPSGGVLSSPRETNSSNSWWKERPKQTFGGETFGGSRYKSRGGFSSSPYRSRGTFGGGGRSFPSPRSFGRGGRR